MCRRGHEQLPTTRPCDRDGRRVLETVALRCVDPGRLVVVRNALERRRNATPDEEFREALRQVYRIAESRLRDVIQ